MNKIVIFCLAIFCIACGSSTNKKNNNQSETKKCSENEHLVKEKCVSDKDVSSCGKKSLDCSEDLPDNSEASCDGEKCSFKCKSDFEKSSDEKSCKAKETETLKSCGKKQLDCSKEKVPADSEAICKDDECSFKCKEGFHYNNVNGPTECIPNESINSCGPKAEDCTKSEVPKDAEATCNGTKCSFKCKEGYHTDKEKEPTKCVPDYEETSCSPKRIDCTKETMPKGAMPLCDGEKCSWACEIGYCFIGNTCLEKGSVDPKDQCKTCQPKTNRKAYIVTVGQTCKDTLFCSDASVCDAKGKCNVVTTEKNCGSGKYCRESSKSCEKWVCDPKFAECQAGDILKSCKTNGSAYITTFCQLGCNDKGKPQACFYDAIVDNLKAYSKNANTIIISWDSVNTQTGGTIKYRLERSETKDFKAYVELAKQTALQYEDKLLDKGKVYYYRIKVDDDGKVYSPSKIVFSNNKVLLISEIASGYSNYRWIEIYNDAPYDLEMSDFQIDLDGKVYSLPKYKIGAGEFVIYRTTYGSQSFKNVDYKNLFHLKDPKDKKKTFYIPYADGFLEILDKNKMTVDFVRWGSNKKQPKTGPEVIAAAPAIVNGKTGSGGSIGRVNFDYSLELDKLWVTYKFNTPYGKNVDLSAVTGTDTDKDGVSDNDEINTYKTDHNKYDTDNDGFSDGEEIFDYGVGGLNIKELGADPLKRDIFVEVDYIENKNNKAIAVPIKAAFDKIKKSFKDSKSLKGQMPVQVHFDLGDMFDKAPGINPKNHDLGGGGDEIPYVSCVSINGGFVSSGRCSDFYKFKRKYFDNKRMMVFHYAIIGDRGIASGEGEIFGNDFVVTRGSIKSTKISQYIINSQAKTFMHELGHNLGLRHGGFENQNYKPNYLSIMNYIYKCIDTDHNGDYFYKYNGYRLRPKSTKDYKTNQYDATCLLDFSYGTMSDLDENKLDETKGITGKGPAIDFNNDGDKKDTNLKFNINYRWTSSTPAKYSTLKDYNDWANLSLIFRTYSSGASVLDGHFDDKGHEVVSCPFED